MELFDEHKSHFEKDFYIIHRLFLFQQYYMVVAHIVHSRLKTYRCLVVGEYRMNINYNNMLLHFS